MKRNYSQLVDEYVKGVLDGSLIVADYVVKACQRYVDDLQREDLEFRKKPANLVISVIETIMVHRQGERQDGKSLMNTPLLLEPWQLFLVYNLIGFYRPGSDERRYKEAFIFVPRKNGKTMLIAGIALGLAILERKSGSVIYIVAASQKQAIESFEDIVYSLKAKGFINDFRVRNNNAEHSIYMDFFNERGSPDGSLSIQALAANPDAQDSFNCNIAIADRRTCPFLPATA